MINDDDTEFERYFGFKIGEEVDIAAHLGYKPKIKPKEKHKRKHTSEMNFEEKIAHTKHSNPKVKAPTMAKHAAKPPIPKPQDNQRDFGKVVKNKILGIDEENKYDFNKLGNAHIYGNQYKLVSDSDEESPEKAIDGLKLPQFFNPKIKIPDTVIKPVIDQKVQYMSRNDQMIEKNKTLNYSLNPQNQINDMFKVYKENQKFFSTQKSHLDSAVTQFGKKKSAVKMPSSLNESDSSSETLADPTVNVNLKPLQGNIMMARSQLHENLLYEK